MTEINNRIEEVIAKSLYEQARQGADLLYELLHRFNPEPDERYELWTKKWGDWESANPTIQKIYLIQARKICQLFPQPLDDKKLMKGIAQIICCFYPDDTAECKWCEEKGGCPQWEDIKKEAVQILALLPPKIEEARRQERERIIKEGEACGAVSEQGIDCVKMWNFWQALKGGE